MPFEALTAISSVDGRYRETASACAEYFSEYALIKKRIIVECAYLVALSENSDVGLRRLTAGERTILENLLKISVEDARIVKKIEKEGHEGIPATNHDVKAVEYFIKGKFTNTSLRDISEWIHFGLTSEDVNSVAWGFALRSSLENVILPAIGDILKSLDQLATEHASSAMLARTHGQPATPTTFGKEMRVFASRLVRQLEQLKTRPILVKFGGATGNYNAHVVAAPKVDWPMFAAKFISGLNEGHAIPIELNEVTTQIEPHDTYAEMFDNLRRVNTILIGLSQDIWRYISDDWVTQKSKEGEVGSSAMPHKVNPIDFENAEGNLGVANALFEHFSRKLPISRLQRDLSDSTVLRTFGTAFAHSLVAYKSLLRGLGKISANTKAMLEELQAHPEVLAEAIQTVLRREGMEVPYEQLMALTRGKEISLDDFATFIDGLSIDAKVKARLKALRPENYVGLAAEIAQR